MVKVVGPRGKQAVEQVMKKAMKQAMKQELKQIEKRKWVLQEHKLLDWDHRLQWQGC